jgi:hypothetical protein
LSLWEAYNRRLLEYRERSVFPVLSFDSGDGFLKGFSAVLDIFRLTPPPGGLGFFAPEMVHNNVWQAASLPAEIDQLCRALQSVSMR